jgi:hypothetical protein
MADRSSSGVPTTKPRGATRPADPARQRGRVNSTKPRRLEKLRRGIDPPDDVEALLERPSAHERAVAHQEGRSRVGEVARNARLHLLRADRFEVRAGRNLPEDPRPGAVASTRDAGRIPVREDTVPCAKTSVGQPWGNSRRSGEVVTVGQANGGRSARLTAIVARWPAATEGHKAEPYFHRFWRRKNPRKTQTAFSDPPVVGNGGSTGELESSETLVIRGKEGGSSDRT